MMTQRLPAQQPVQGLHSEGVKHFVPSQICNPVQI
jgi:hypothetical protein